MAAGFSIFSLLGSIMVDSSKADESIKKTEKNAESMASKLGNGIKTAGKWGLAIGGAAIAGGTALFALTNKAADATDRIDKMSQKIGISRTAFQEYEYILSQNGTSIDKLQVGMKTLTQRMQESTEGTGIGAEAFEKLGLSALDASGAMKSQEQMFEETAKTLMGMPEGAEKSQLAFELFGKAGLELMPMLNGSAEGFDELKQAANDMGLVLSDDAIDAGAKFTDTMDNVKRSLGGVVANIGVEVMPMFQGFLDWVMDHMPEIQEFITTAFEKIGIFVNAAVDIFRDYLIPIFISVYEWVEENWPTIVAIIKGAFDTIKFVWDNVLAPVLGFLWDGLKKVVDFIADNWPTISAIIEGVFDAIKFVWDNVLKPVLGFLWDGLKKVVDFVANNFKGMQNIIESTFEGIGKAVDAVTDTFSWLVDKIQDAWDWLNKWNNTKVKDKTPSKPSSGSYYGGYSIDGSNAAGLSTVPFDGYISELHKNEEVLTADDPRNQNNNKSGVAKQQIINLNIGTLIADDYGLKQLERKLKDVRINETGRLGGALA